MFFKTQKAPISRDRVILFDEDAKTCEILPVEAETDEIVRASTRVFPKADLEQRISRQGKVFVFRAPSRIIQKTEHLARVERNIIIRQIAQYDRPITPGPDWFKWGLMFGFVLVAIIAAAT